MKRKSAIKIIDYLSILILVCLPSLMWTFNHIDRYTNWVTFYLFLIVIGAIVGLVIFKLITKNNIELKKHKTKKGVGLLHAIITLSILLTPLIDLIINENIGVKSEINSYKIDRIGQSGGGKRGTKAHYLFILNNDKKIERLQFGKAFVNNYSQRDSVLLNLNIGCLGFSYYSIPQTE